jgi:hypothetical protein
MIGMLLVLLMIMDRAKDPDTWRWLTNEPEGEPTTVDSDRGDSAHAQANTSSSDPTDAADLDPEELDAAREEFQAISDRQPLLPEEMPSYWRMFNWVHRQPGYLLQRRSRKSVVFTDFVQAPDRLRGSLVHLRLHLMRSLTHETPESTIGIDRVHEAWGWTDESHPWLYVVVFAEKPSGMPIGPDIREEASFDGYFLKLMSYEAHQAPGKPLFAPLLVGRIVWHPSRTQSGSASDGTWFWLTILGGALIALVMLVRWVIVSRAVPLTASTHSAQSSSTAIESWLEQSKPGAAGPEKDGTESG